MCSEGVRARPHLAANVGSMNPTPEAPLSSSAIDLWSDTVPESLNSPALALRTPESSRGELVAAGACPAAGAGAAEGAVAAEGEATLAAMAAVVGDGDDAEAVGAEALILGECDVVPGKGDSEREEVSEATEAGEFTDAEGVLDTVVAWECEMAASLCPLGTRGCRE